MDRDGSNPLRNAGVETLFFRPWYLEVHCPQLIMSSQVGPLRGKALPMMVYSIHKARTLDLA
jgi:hypothetical protein